MNLNCVSADPLLASVACAGVALPLSSADPENQEQRGEKPGGNEPGSCDSYSPSFVPIQVRRSYVG